MNHIVTYLMNHSAIQAIRSVREGVQAYLAYV
jgi:hypothetical protein